MMQNFKICKICQIKYPKTNRNSCPDCFKIIKRKWQKKYYKANKEKCLASMDKYRKENKNKINKYYSDYYQGNKKRVNFVKNEYKKKRRKNDPSYKLRRNISRMINAAFKNLT